MAKPRATRIARPNNKRPSGGRLIPRHYAVRGGGTGCGVCVRCTTQACDLRDNYDRFLATGAKVYGVSADSAAKHAKFRAKYDLPFPLLVDADHAVAEAFGTWVQKSMYGRTYMGMERSTFVIGPDGRLESVKPKAHAEQLLGALTT